MGGDSYDAFVLPSCELRVSVGDVAGRGLSAAICDGPHRPALRAFPLIGRSPTRCCASRTATNSSSSPGPRSLRCAQWLAVVRDSPDRFSGAPRSSTVVPRSGCRFLELETGLPLNAARIPPVGSATLILAPGALLLCYTDALSDVISRSMRVLSSYWPSPLEMRRGAWRAATCSYDQFDRSLSFLSG